MTTSRRDVTACTDLATRVIRRRHARRGVLYEVAYCHRHRSITAEWGRTTYPLDAGGRFCGAVDDFRTPAEIVRSHFLWLVSGVAPLSAPPADRDGWGVALRAAHADALSFGGGGPVVEALGRAAQAAEVNNVAEVLRRLAVAETLAVAARH
ncbi:hypothetical protein ACFVWX_13495 [Streptomyces sp. NPDC058220]|uniref:hypothetical protein n=1 Tax=Streptomyces sp. NPDC058220 TaxID=3346387 RepID=UPI0036E02AFE